jgi:hypothetical protein
MQKWEYQIITAQIVIVTDQLKKQKKNQPNNLDPKIDWSTQTWEERSGEIYARVAWSMNGYLTSCSNCLNEQGNQGWELVGMTPSLQISQGSGSAFTDYTKFQFILKRPSV